MLESEWKYNLGQLHEFRQELKKRYAFPVKQEFHTREFIQDKNPYHGLYAPEVRREILFEYVRHLAQLRAQAIITVVDKTKIKNTEYDVLEKAFTYNIQRIENGLSKKPNPELFMVITDEGRVGRMTKVSRKVQRINYIPSKFEQASTRQEIQLLIEDPLPKSSSQSYFIQAADTIAFISMLYATKHLCSNMEWANRVKRVLAPEDALGLMNVALPILHTKASRENSYGIVCYPR